MKKYTTIILAAAVMLMTSCYYDSEEALYPQGSDNCDTTNVTFTGSIVPILAASCYSCHSDANAAQFGNNIHLQSYDDVKANLDRLYGAVTWQPDFPRMPRDGAQLDDCSIRKIEIWMAQGAPESFAPVGGVR